METEVLGIPSDSLYGELDVDPGRYSPKRPKEKVSFYKNSFKTVSIRNIKNTAPYMHNGVFQDLNQVMEFYNNGGGVGHDLDLNNQTLGTDSLHLTDTETQNIIKFMESL
jgi:cytochrome c peroxidase